MSTTEKPESVIGHHTPGTWDWLAIGANASGGNHLYIIDAHNRKIAALWGKAAEKEANARLISAVPDQYEAGTALDRLFLVIESAVRETNPKHLKAVVDAFKANRAALAKATGATP